VVNNEPRRLQVLYVKNCLALFTIAISTTALAAGVDFIGQRNGTSAAGEPVKICLYGEPLEAELQIRPFAACPPSIQVLNLYTGGYAGAMNAPSQRAVQDAAANTLPLVNPQTSASAGAPPPWSPEPRGLWAAEWQLWLRQSLDLCSDHGVEMKDQCRRIADKAYKDAIACNDGQRESCGDRDNDLTEFGRWERPHAAAKASLSSPGSPSLSQVSALQSQLSMERCLHQATDRTIARCGENNCDMIALTRNIAAAQRARCGATLAQ
jgi:hypothetical protein